MSSIFCYVQYLIHPLLEYLGRREQAENQECLRLEIEEEPGLYQYMVMRQ